MYLGLDIGTSSVKALLTDEVGGIAAEASAPLEVRRPAPLWSEQDPDDWVRASKNAILDLPRALRTRVQAIGLSGQMHGAALLGANDRPLRPAILWNDGRAHEECGELEARAPALRQITGNMAMPGFTAPKLLWVGKHEPEVFRAIQSVLLPKDFVRLAFTGEKVTDASDAAGTLWLDVAQRQWSETLLEATDLKPGQMPRVMEGPDASGRLRPSIAAELGLPAVRVAAGGGDNAASALGVGVINPGEALLSLGTSGVLFVVSDGFRPNPDRAGHAFCHALSDRWHQMAVILSAASAVDAAARLAGYDSIASAVRELGPARSSDPIFLPYLSGERTPHNDAHASGVWFGVTHDTERQGLVRAALEGVAFALADGMDALDGGAPEAVIVVGGGSRIAPWGQILADGLGRRMEYRERGEVGAALGAARLAQMCVTGARADEVCRQGALVRAVEPDPAAKDRVETRRALFRRLYFELKPAFREPRS
jgi:xylulokinase